MSNPHYTIRNYQTTDFNKYVQLHSDVEKLEPTGRCVSPRVISENLDRPNYSPEQDLFIAEVAESMVGYMDVTPELNIGRTILNCFIHPDHRKKRLATRLLGCATHQAKTLGAKVVQVNIPPDNEIAKRVLLKLGFKFVRRFLELELGIAKAHCQDTGHSALQYRNLQRGEEDKLTQLQNRAFADTWGYNPDTVEEIVYRTNLSNHYPEDIILTYDRDKPIGYCWTRVYETTTGEIKGQIFMLGVDPDYRCSGIGKRVLYSGLTYLKSKGLHTAGLTVDSENKAARALYSSVGFKTRTSNLWYEKAIAQDTPA